MVRQTLSDGPRIAAATILGTVTGLVIWSAAAGAGLSAVLLTDPAIYHGLLLAAAFSSSSGSAPPGRPCAAPPTALPSIPPAPTRQQTEQVPTS